ncbi:MAG: hypothetical protein KDD64_09130 [Bdellovibrionales bacterium]|nr:hypothetical protein [Bdellovibrionales bacterium]
MLQSDSLNELRKAIRTSAIQEALHFTNQRRRELGYPEIGGEYTSQSILVATGHQIEVFHSGVFQKFALLDRFSRENPRSIVALSVLLDLDPNDRVFLSLPSQRGESVSREVFQISTSERFPLHQTVTIDPAFTDSSGEFQDSISSDPGTREQARKWISFMSSQQGERAVVALSRARLLFHGKEVRYGDLPFSKLIQLEAAQTFFRKICRECKSFASLYNEELRNHRRERKIKNQANPFPDLEINGGAFELPLWAFSPDFTKRERVYGKQEGGKTVLQTEATQWEISADGEEQTCPQDQVILAPRGALVSLFFRLLCFDFFIHGLGGEKYDAFTDRLLARCFGIKHLPFAVVSADKYLFETLREKYSKLKASVQFRQECYKKPELAYSRISQSQRDTLTALSKERDLLIERLAQVTGAERQIPGKALAANTKAIRESLDGALGTQLYEEVEVLSSQEKVLFERGFPYFLFANW